MLPPLRFRRIRSMQGPTAYRIFWRNLDEDSVLGSDRISGYFRKKTGPRRIRTNGLVVPAIKPLAEPTRHDYYRAASDPVPVLSERGMAATTAVRKPRSARRAESRPATPRGLRVHRHARPAAEKRAPARYRRIREDRRQAWTGRSTAKDVISLATDRPRLASKAYVAGSGLETSGLRYPACPDRSNRSWSAMLQPRAQYGLCQIAALSPFARRWLSPGREPATPTGSGPLDARHPAARFSPRPG